MTPAIKLDVVIPDDHHLEIDLPGDLPSGPAEVIVRPVAPEAEPTSAAPRTLADRFAGHVGLIDSRVERGGPGLSDSGGELFAESLEAKRRAGHL